jgi:predicted RNA polymerase sigma factor
MEATTAVETMVRTSYGRLVAYLAARSRDVAGAEDALSEALRAALATWPRNGVPEKPEAWLLAAARRKLIDAARHRQVRVSAEPAILAAIEEAATMANETKEFPDERLKLLFICAHPAIDAAARTPLMLHAVLGLDAARIASAFLVAPAAMGQRLVRAKGKIRDAGIAFAVPEAAELPERLESVLAAIYAAYGTGWEDAAGVDSQQRGLAEEALRLARVTVQLLSAAPEAKGLLALILFCESRRAARRCVDGRFVPLAEQDLEKWSRPMVAEAEQVLLEASRARTPGRFQLEAAIQSAHAQRLFTGRTNWAAVARLHGALVRLTPTLGARVSHAAAVMQAGDKEAALRLLDELSGAAAVAEYQAYWATRAHVLAHAGRAEAAKAAYRRAIGLTTDAAVRAFLHERAEALAGV